MVKLSPMYAKRLRAIAETPGRSGNFWRRLGVFPATLYALERKGLIAGERAHHFNRSAAIYASWTITDAGRRALEGQADD